MFRFFSNEMDLHVDSADKVFEITASANIDGSYQDTSNQVQMDPSKT